MRANPGVASSANAVVALNVRYDNAGVPESDAIVGTPGGALDESVSIADPEPGGRSILPP